jgi:DNA-binding CsgD family transcriptional regulator
MRSRAPEITLTEAVGYVTRGRGPRVRPALGWESLTPTELTAAQAVAEGLSNPQIAACMFISRRTVTTHLTSIFRKIGISSRAELAARAARRDDQGAVKSRVGP